MIVPFWSLAPLLLASVPQTLFVLFYAVRPLGAGQWWRVDTGRALFLKAVSLAVVLDLLACHVVFSIGVLGVSFTAPAPGWPVAETIGYWLVFVSVCYQLGVLLKQRYQEYRVRRLSAQPQH